jgi:hypothetical protein
MNKYLTLAAGATVLLGAALGTSLPAYAQGTTPASGPFQDVPADHWAYGAVNTLQKDGIVIGYPDGTYGGRRAMTRYEFAEAIARLIPMIPQIDTSQFAKESELQDLSTSVNAKLATEDQEISAIEALDDEFKTELTSLGVDVSAVKTRLDSDEARLSAVEAEQARVHITGELNVFFRDGINTSSHANAPLDEDGYRAGADNDVNTNGDVSTDRSFWLDPTVDNDFLLTIVGKVSDTAKAVVEIDATNGSTNYDEINPSTKLSDIDDSVLSIASIGSLSARYTQGGNDGLSVFRAYLDQPVNDGFDPNADLQAGIIGEHFTPYTFMAVTPDSYVQLPEETPDITLSGAKLTTQAGPVKFNLYAGKTSFTALTAESPTAYANNGLDLGPTSSQRPGSIIEGGTLPQVNIDQSAGAHVTVGFDGLTLGGTAVLARVAGSAVAGFNNNNLNNQGNVIIGPQLDAATGKNYNTLAVYGADLSGNIPGVPGLGIDSEFAISQTGSGSKFGNVNSTKGNEAYDANLSYDWGGVALKAGYTLVYNNFESPGYWGKIGEWANPSNIKGEVLSASYSPMSSLGLSASGNILRGASNTIQGYSPLGTKDSLNSVKVGANYAVTSAYNVNLGYEWVQWILKGQTGVNPGTATEGYTTIGLSHDFSPNAKLKLEYQILNFGAGKTGTSFDPAGSSNGGVAVSQLDVKF